MNAVPPIEPDTRARFARLQSYALAAGVVGAALCAFGVFVNQRQFFFSYLFGYLFWAGLAFGCFGLTMIHHLTGGGWGFAIRRFLEAGISTLPLLAVLFAPFFFGLHELYPWAQREIVLHDESLQHKHAYLNVPAYTVRMVVFFAFWLILGWLLTRWSAEQDRTADLAPTRRLRALSGPGLALYALVGTLMFVDWVMVLERDWYSTIFPIMVLIGQMLAALSACIVLLAWLRERSALREVYSTEQLHALGNLLLAFVMLWAYMSVSQLIIIWSGNLPREISWYLHRVAGGWKAVAIFLGLFHFAVPFLLLLSRETKRRIGFLSAIAAGVFCVHAVEVFWQVAPSMHPRHLAISWLDFAAFLAVGGFWVSAFFARLKNHPLLPANDPRLEPALELAHAHHGH